MQASRVLPSMEVRERAPLLREVRVRARHGENASDAEDPRGTSQLQTHSTPRCSRSSHTQNRQCLTSFFPIRNLCLDQMFFHVFLLFGIKVTWDVCPETTADCLYFISRYFPCYGAMFLLEEIKFLVNIS